MLFAINYISVFIYGVLIMGFFLNIKMNKRSVIYISAYVVGGGFIQLLLNYVYGAELVEKIYPLVIHVPLLLFFCIAFKKKFNFVLFSLFTSYLFTVPRRWVGEAVASFFNNNPYISLISKIITSVVLLIIIYKYLRPIMNRILEYPSTRITLLVVVPAFSYIITYTTTVYTDALYHSSMLVVGLFIISFNFLFYTFLIAYFLELDKSFASQTEQTILRMQMETTILQIEDYKIAQTEGAIYRHDLRHHLHYLSNCISENHTAEALDYIKKINKNVEATHVKNYCENTSVNMILSAYVAKAKKENIDILVIAIVPKVSELEFIDICVILSNGLENAINACIKISEEREKKISVSCRFENSKLMIEICNTFEGEIQFIDEIPIALKKNHGLGVKSIVVTVH